MTSTENKVWELPPLILHPFADRASSETLLANSKTALMAAGLIPGEGNSQDDLVRKLLTGRFAEIRMLFFLGKDVMRWLEQCVEFIARTPEFAGQRIREQSFAALVTRHMPEAVGLKLQGWGVHDAGVIFARAIALNQLFAEPPEFEHLAQGFVRNYHRYTDHLFDCWLQTTGFREVTSAEFRFDLYASGEYTKMLENEWGTE
jgi:hypothetical protein